MTEHQLTCDILLAAQKALLGAITPHLRMVSIKWDGLKSLSCRAHFDSQPAQADIDEMDAVVSQIIADVPFEWADMLDVVVSDAPVAELEPLGTMVFLRKER